MTHNKLLNKNKAIKQLKMLSEMTLRWVLLIQDTLTL